MLVKKQSILKVFLAFVFFESLSALYFLAIIPSDIKNEALFGLSISRLLLMVPELVTALFASVIFLFASQFVIRLDDYLSNPRKKLFLISIAGGMFILGVLFFLIPPQRFGEATYQRLFPLVGLWSLLNLQILIAQFVWTRQKLDFSFILENHSTFRIVGAVFFVFALLWLLITWSRIGVERESSGWLSPGTPILFQQLLFSICIGLLFFVSKKYLEQFKRLDLFIGVFIWVFTCVVWWSTPVTRLSYFTPKPTPPNFEYYPYSDAAHYDWFAQSFLIGASRDIGVTPRPLYSLFLALLHFIGGSGFRNVLFMQVIVLAIIPSIMYLLVKKFGGRSTGIAAALLLVFREKNAITLTNIIEVSHVKLLMSDVPTMLTIILFIYFFIKWFRDQDDKYRLGVLSGAFLGFSIFIRSQVLLLAPIAVIGIILIEKFRWKLIYRKIIVFLLGMLVVVAPWVWRNYQLSGRVVVEYLDFYTRFIGSSYSSFPGDINMLPGESDEKYRDRINNQVVNYIIDHPVEVARTYLSYFLHDEIASVAYLPMSFRFDTIYSYVDSAGFWTAPYLGDIPKENLIEFFLIVCVVIFGVGIMLQQFGWLGLMPLFFQMAYSFSSVPVHQSGWRFILPVDWVTILYFCVGLKEIFVFIYSLFVSNIDIRFSTFIINYPSRPTLWNGAGLMLAAFTFLGVAFPVIEWSIPERYPELTRHEMIQTYMPDGFVLDNGDQVTASSLETFLETDPAATVLYGRALYPQYYFKGKFWGESSLDLLEASRYDRLQFETIGPMRGFAFLPLDQAPQYFPHASDVFAVGCNRNKAIQVLVLKVNGRLIISSAWHGLNCSIME